MSTNIIHELKKFLNNPQQITLEFSFLDFESSVFQGIRVVKKLTTNKNVLTVILVKNKTLGSVSFFFRDGPTYQFALTVEEANLYNDNNSNESLISKFIVLGNDPIRGTQLKISSYSITIYASINDGKARGLDSFSFNQLYSDCTSVKSYSYALGIETLKKPTYQEPKKNSSNVPPVIPTSPPDKDLAFRNFIIFVIISVVVGFFIYSNNNKSTTDDSLEFSSVDTTAVAVDTTAVAVDTALTFVDTTAVAAVNPDAEPTEISNSNSIDVASNLYRAYFIGRWRDEYSSFVIYANGDYYIKYDGGIEKWTKWEYYNGKLYFGTGNNNSMIRQFIISNEANSFIYREDGDGTNYSAYRTGN